MATNVIQKAVGSSPTEMTDSQMVDDGTGVGIGASSPAAKLHVQATSEQLRVGYDGSNYTTFTVSSTGKLTIGVVGSAHEVTLNVGGNDRMELSNNGVEWDVDVNPSLDNEYTCGAPSQRWSLVRGVTITSGDLRFENDFVFTEHYNAGEGLPRGLALVDDRDPKNPKLLAFFAEDGTVYTSAVRALSELPGTVRVLREAQRTRRTLSELAELNA